MSRPLAGLAMAPTAKDNPGSPLLWLWIVVSVIGIVAVVMLIARISGRRSALAAGWHSRMVDACTKASELYDTMSVAAPGALAAGDGPARLAGIQRRADDLTQDLCSLRETAPNGMEKSHVADVLTALQAVRCEFDGERQPGNSNGAGSCRAPQPAQVHDLLISFDASLRALRSPAWSARQ
jgi:hypothetical protein